jgi:hypothetical protein
MTDDPGGDEAKASFFKTLPGILTGIAAVLTASATLTGVLLTQCGGDDSDENSAATTSTGEAVTSTASAEPEPPPDGRIAFVSGNRGIVSTNAHGGDVTSVTDSGGSDAKPAWSPDGTQLAFARAFGRNIDICLVNADGGGFRRLTRSKGEDKKPTWSRDGSKDRL